MAATPLQDIEAKIHERFGNSPPTKEEGRDFLLKEYPRMDGGAAIAIAIVALVLQGWQVYRSEQDRRLQTKTGDGNKCPKCGSYQVKKSSDGSFICENDHTW